MSLNPSARQLAAGAASVSTDKPMELRPTVRQRIREGTLRALGAVARPFIRLVRRGSRLFWALGVHANTRRVGPGVQVYGPVRFLGTQNVTLGGWGNLYGDVVFETVDNGSIEIGDDFAINRGAILAAHERISIGDHVMIAEYVSVRDNGHAFADLTRPMRHQDYDVAPIRIGNDVWIGRGAAILKGVSIGDGAIVAANAVVTKDIPPMQIWAGVPARLLRRRTKTDKAT